MWSWVRDHLGTSGSSGTTCAGRTDFRFCSATTTAPTLWWHHYMKWGVVRKSDSDYGECRDEPARDAVCLTVSATNLATSRWQRPLISENWIPIPGGVASAAFKCQTTTPRAWM